MSMLELITTHGALTSGIIIWNGSLVCRSLELDYAILTHCPGFVRFEYRYDNTTSTYFNIGSSTLQYIESSTCRNLTGSQENLNRLRLYRSGVSCPSDEVVKIKLCVQAYNFASAVDICDPSPGPNTSRVELEL